MDNEDFHIERIKRDRDKLLLRRNLLIDEINTVFKDVTREGGISLREACIIDDCGTPEECARARLLDTDTHWTQVDIEQLDPGCSCLSFVDAIGYRYYAPAYMVYTLKSGYARELGEKEVDSNIFEFFFYGLNASSYGSPELCCHVRKKHSLFTYEEKICIAKFLAFDAELITDQNDSDSFEALKNEWSEYLPHSERKHLISIWPNAFD